MNILKTAFLCFCFSHSMTKGSNSSKNKLLGDSSKNKLPGDSEESEGSFTKSIIIVLITCLVALALQCIFWSIFGYFNKISFLNNLGDEKTDGVIGTIIDKTELDHEQRQEKLVATDTKSNDSDLPIMIGGIAGTAVIGGIGGGAYYFWPEEKVVKKGWFS